MSNAMSRGQLWLETLVPNAKRLEGLCPSVQAADGELNSEAVRFIAVVPDANNHYPRAAKGEVGLPILGSVLGEGATTSLSVAVSIACGSVLMTPFCLLILEREKARAEGNNTGSTLAMLPVLMWRSLKKPIVMGPLLGVILSAIGIKMPELFLAAIKPLGLSATAAALFLTGVILSARKLQINTVVITSTIAKLLIQPAIAWGIVLIFGLHGSVAITAILMIALSAGFFGVVFGNRFGVQSPDAEAVLLLSSVLCILSLPLFISLTSGI
ncbi:AEC family transporter [Salmonella enterica subsp. diarizonae serovar 53:z10:z]|nr:AEC family transporter [Salmonella enterica]EBK3631525.1 AEC family transporter [Salmonella enterica]EDR5594711.1 AEC family transporter [Salmonella enterica subsp. diarizonae]EDU6307451.1 AEC family transporter [Salmonella enterica subsp. diarizonae serovar 53:z10:z]EGW0491557.1 AEC family transporter [Salmonella enterica]